MTSQKIVKIRELGNGRMLAYPVGARNDEMLVPVDQCTHIRDDLYRFRETRREGSYGFPQIAYQS